MNRFIDGIISVPARAVDMINGMTGGARDTGLRSRVLLQIKIRIIESPTEKRDHVMATRAPSRRFDISIPLQRYFASFTNAEQICLIVKRAEMMGAVKPAF